MMNQWINQISLLWLESVLGTLVILVGVGIGWMVGSNRRNWLVLPVAWWLAHVVRPLLLSRSWLRRAVIIALNNALICFAVVLLGSAGPGAWLGVASIGLGLGIALRQMLPIPMDEPDGVQSTRAGRRVLVTIGLILNLIEIPAIMLTAGVALSQGAWSSTLQLSDGLSLFGGFVVPMLAVAAAGEAMWMTANPEVLRICSSDGSEERVDS